METLSMTMAELEDCTLDELREIARSLAISGYTRLKKHDLIILLLRANAEKAGIYFWRGNSGNRTGRHRFPPK